MRVIRLSSVAPGEVRRVICASVSPGEVIAGADGKAPQSWVTLTRTGRFWDRRYGNFEITSDMLLAMKANFAAGVFGQDVFLDVSHNFGDGAAARVLELQVENGRLRARVEWTAKGIKAVNDDGYCYLSAEYAENFKDNETGREYGPVLLGAGLTIRPVIKHLDRVDPIRQLSEVMIDVGSHVSSLHPELARKILSEDETMFKELLARLQALVADKKLSQMAAEQIIKAFTTAGEALTDQKQLQAVYDQFSGVVDQVAAAGAQPLVINLSTPAATPTGVSLEDVRKLLAEQDAAAKKALADRDAKIAENQKVLSDTLGAATLDAEVKKQLSDAITPLISNTNMTGEDVKALATAQIALASQLSAARRLSAMGFEAGRRGVPFITVDESNSVKALQEQIDKRLGYAGLSDAERYRSTGGQLQTRNKKLADEVLARFDQDRGADLHAESKRLAAGDGVISDVAVPAIFERTVIREALYQLVGLGFVDAGTDTFSSSHIIPYSYRDQTAATRTGTRTYEGQGVKRAGVKQDFVTAYPIPQKLAFEVSDELRYLTSNGQLDWDAVGENTRNAVRIIGEDTEQLLFDEPLRASDEFMAVAVSNENVAGVNGTNRIFALANFPVVRPRADYNLQGQQIGNTLNPIVVSYGGAPKTAFDGTGSQAAGTYYVLDYNLGELRFVTEAGALVTPPNGTAIVVSYSYSNNCSKWNIDIGSFADAGVQYDDFLYRFGLRRNVIESDRYYTADMALMSRNVSTAIEQARTFAANFKKPGTDLLSDGNLGSVKGVPTYNSTAPGLAIADNRVLIGQRGVTRFRMTKPWQMGQLQDQRDSNGRFTGKKEAYGDQFIVLKTPEPLRGAYTSLVLYSGSGRVTRVS